MYFSILGNRSFSSVLAAWHSRLIGRQFLPMLLSLPGFRIWMITINFIEHQNRAIIALCHISGICPVEIDRLKMLVR